MDKKDKIIAKLENEIIELKQENKRLRQMLLAFMNENTPSSKQRKRSNPPKGGFRFPGKPKKSNGGGIKLPETDEIQEHNLDCCPNCGNKNLEFLQTRTKKVLDFPIKPIICTEHKIHEYNCKNCNCVVASKNINEMQTYGSRIRSFATMLKSNGLSFQKIANSFNQLGALSLSATTILNFTTLVANKLSKTRGAILRTMKKSKIAHKDETGFRCDGKNGYVWVTCNEKNAVFFAENTRSKQVAKKLEGKNQISITDGYKGYSDDKIRQLCWAHLLRKANRYAQDYPELEDQYNRLNDLFKQMQTEILHPPDPKQYKKLKWILDDIVRILSSRKHAKGLYTYIKNGGDKWLTALQHSGVPLTNNHAERMIRPIVIQRKMMGCYRNKKGKDFINIVQSVMTTWKLQAKNVFLTLNAKLT